MTFRSSLYWGVLLFTGSLFTGQTLNLEISEIEIKDALYEINTSNIRKPPFRKNKEIERVFDDIFSKVLPAAEETCKKYLGEKADCVWEVNYIDQNIFNAFASGKNEITFYYGLARQIFHEDELAFVVAHEIGHHIGNHVKSSKARAITGMILGGIIGAATGDATIAANTAQAGANIAVGMYSSGQEVEADFIAVEILDQSGYDLKKARDIHIRMTGVGASSAFSGFLSSHPSGPERLIMHDRSTEYFKYNE